MDAPENVTARRGTDLCRCLFPEAPEDRDADQPVVLDAPAPRPDAALWGQLRHLSISLDARTRVRCAPDRHFALLYLPASAPETTLGLLSAATTRRCATGAARAASCPLPALLRHSIRSLQKW